ncbi:unnamed protein product [Hymenolepis diminuta]|uniref:F-box/kelch-repeat protein n=1 Tax=Hymenolepis diminuta TaxID=6216 RepID=A0A0R3SLH1_HYMDI|nr:unnamed protein product [Hymenolepis diminuta]
MIEESSWCAAVNIPDSGVLFIGGIGSNEIPLRYTELLPRRSTEGGGGVEKWQWLPCTPMNKGHWRVYVVGYGDNVDTMEMVNVAAGGQWTSLISIDQLQNLRNQSVARVGSELFLKG